MRTGLVTGGGRGIGAAVARALCHEGYAVAVNCNKSYDEALRLSAELNSCGFVTKVFRCDVTSPDEVKRMFEDIERELSPVSVLVNNAGAAQQKLFCDITDKDFQDILSVNLTGAFNCIREALPYMIREKKGSIINIASMWGQVGASCEVHYSAAKAGLIGLTKALAKEVAPSGIRVNCVSPGAIFTDMLPQDKETIDRLKEEIPLGYIGSPEDVANLVAFLASEKASYITGQVIGVNGGMVI